MEVKLHLDKEFPQGYMTGGGYSRDTLAVYIDATLPIVLQRTVVIHEILEGYCKSWGHDKIDELTTLIEDALLQLDGLQD